MTKTIKLGSYGQAFDLAGDRRAYTYKHQPGNQAAWRIGDASSRVEAGGDLIDRGLSLLKVLEAGGFGVFELDETAVVPAPEGGPEPMSAEAMWRLVEEARIAYAKFMAADVHSVSYGDSIESYIARAIESSRDDQWRAALAAQRTAADGDGRAAVIRQALYALEAAPQPVEHVLPFSNVCDCTQCSSVRATKSAKAILRAAVAQ